MTPVNAQARPAAGTVDYGDRGFFCRRQAPTQPKFLNDSKVSPSDASILVRQLTFTGGEAGPPATATALAWRISRPTSTRGRGGDCPREFIQMR